MTLIHYLAVLSTVFSILANHGAAQNSVTMNSNMDNTLFEDATGSFSSGAGPNFYAGRNNLGQLRRGVLAFDVAGNVPAGATVDSARLTLRMSMANSGPFDCELRALLADWGEGTSNSSGGQGAPSTTNDATWLHTFYDTQFWSTPGGDISPVVSAVQTVDAVSHYTWGSTPQMVSDVQAWLDNPATNFGWAVIGNETVNQSAKRFDTRENSIAANRPSLTVFFTPPLSISENNSQTPIGFRLEQNYPNPFNPETEIAYFVDSRQPITLVIYDNLGREVTTLVNETREPGRYLASWNAGDLASGVYYCFLRSGEGRVASQTMVLLK
jgi:hypothetical protein